MNDKESAIRQKAYELWEKAGRPHGRDQEHWHQAAAEMTNGKSALAMPGKPARKAMAAAAASPVRRKK
jgi:hypothetical protein